MTAIRAFNFLHDKIADAPPHRAFKAHEMMQLFDAVLNHQNHQKNGDRTD